MERAIFEMTKEMKKINARDCAIEEVSKKDYKNFVVSNHRQKYAAATIIYGLYLDGELLQLMSFGKPRFNKNYEWEIIRECTKKNYIVRGGTSKLWKYFLKNNPVHSCICYSYPHNGKFTDHYARYCTFKNIELSKPKKKIYFEGKWNGKHKRIDKSILEKQGVDRLLRTKQGQDRTNEQILLDLGFEKKEEDGFSPQIDIYYPFSILYRIDDITDGSFYIGLTENKNDWERNRYYGSGTRWLNHIKKHPNIKKKPDNKEAHEYKITILKEGFKTPKELREAEFNEINKYVIKTKGQRITETKGRMLNILLRLQGVEPYHDNMCEECGGKNGKHKKGCSKYIPIKPCPECGTKGGSHKEGCTRYKQPNVCRECGGKRGAHSPSCSKFKKCPECGATRGRHKKLCSHYKKPTPCPECGVTVGHKKECSKYKAPQPCPECGKINGHRKGCSKYTTFFCKECGGERGKHKKWCSQYKENKVCDECGHITHLKTCSHYTPSKPCGECGALRGHHTHCSQYKKPKQRAKCPECGTLGRHKKGCSKYNPGKICKECGGKNGQHKKGCSERKQPKK